MNIVIISNELSALGWRLAGARALIADQHSVAERFAETRRGTDLLLITADLARNLPDSAFDAALLAGKPLIALIAGLPDGNEPADLEREVEHVLGIAV